jgi:WD40 repeat protein
MGVLTIAFSFDSHFVALGGYGRRLVIVETGEFRDMQRSVLSMEINSLRYGSRQELFIGGTAGEFELWQYSGPRKEWMSARREQFSDIKGAIRSVAIPASENRFYALSCQDRAVHVLSHDALVGCDTTEPLPIPVGQVIDSRLVLESNDKGFDANLRNAETDRIELTLSDKVIRGCTPLYSADRDMVYLACSGNNDSHIQLIRRSDSELVSRLPFPAYLNSLSLSRDSQYLVGAGWNGSGQVRVWDLDTLESIDLPHGQGEFEAIAKFSPNEDLLIVGPAGTRRLTCLRSGTWEKIRDAETSSNWGTFEFSKSSNVLVVGETKKISVWDPDLKLRHWSSPFDGMNWDEKVHRLTLTPDESTIVAHTGQTTIRFWDCKSRSELYSQMIPRGGAESLIFADSNTLHVHATDGWYVLSGKATEGKPSAE